MPAQAVDKNQAHTPVKVAISSRADEQVLKEKLTMAEATFSRARDSMKESKLSVEHRRYLNQLFTTIVATEGLMSW